MMMKLTDILTPHARTLTFEPSCLLPEYANRQDQSK